MQLTPHALGTPALCLTDRNPELVGISPGHSGPELSGLPGLTDCPPPPFERMRRRQDIIIVPMSHK